LRRPTIQIIICDAKIMMMFTIDSDGDNGNEYDDGNNYEDDGYFDDSSDNDDVYDR